MYSHFRSSRGETLISVLTGIIILSIVLFGIINILSSTADVESDTSSQLQISLLEQNATSLIKLTDTKGIAEKEVFYLYKNPNTLTIQVFTGSSNISYAYINSR